MVFHFELPSDGHTTVTLVLGLCFIVVIGVVTTVALWRRS